MKKYSISLCKSMLLHTALALLIIAFALSSCNKEKMLVGEWHTVSGTPNAVWFFDHDHIGWFYMEGRPETSNGFEWSETKDSLILTGDTFRTAYGRVFVGDDTMILSFTGKYLHYTSTIARQ